MIIKTKVLINIYILTYNLANSIELFDVENPNL